MKRQGVRALLIRSDPDWLFLLHDRGIDWVSDRFVLARADVFQKVPKAHPPAPRTGEVRELLARVRSSPVLGEALDVGRRIPDPRGKGQIALVSAGSLYLAVNAKAWAGWSSTGMTPKITSSGHLAWYGTVRGKPTLFGVVMPMRLGRGA